MHQIKLYNKKKTPKTSQHNTTQTTIVVLRWISISTQYLLTHIDLKGV